MNILTKIINKIGKKNLKLEPLGFQIDFYQTDDWLGDLPMYEAKLVDLDDEDIEDAITGRYCDPISVFNEIVDIVDEEMILNGGVQ